MSLIEVVNEMREKIKTREELILKSLEDKDYEMARAQFLGFLAETHYFNYQNQIINDLRTGRSIDTSVSLLLTYLREEPVLDRRVQEEIRCLRAQLAQATLPDENKD